MLPSECYSILDLNEDADSREILKNFKWLVWFYHPDNILTGNSDELKKVVQAFEQLKAGDATANT